MCYVMQYFPRLEACAYRSFHFNRASMAQYKLCEKQGSIKLLRIALHALRDGGNSSLTIAYYVNMITNFVSIIINSLQS